MTEETLFQEALAQPAAERSAFLDAACAGQPELRAAVEALLAAHEASGDLLDRPAAELGHTVEFDSGEGPLLGTGEYTKQEAEVMSGPPDLNSRSDVLWATTDSAGAADALRSMDQVQAWASAEATHPSIDAPASELPEAPGYRVLGEIARGGMGRVLFAHDITLDREVALKVLLPGVNADRFVRESKITARLSHPGIPPVHALGTLADGSPFLAMKLIAGRTLAEEMKRADRPRLLQAFTQVCQAVGFAHSKGIIHRDLKPSNVMVGAFGEVQVMDWGLAKDLAGGEAADEPNSPPVSDGAGTAPSEASDNRAAGGSSDEGTQEGAVLGTPGYMAPEQARGEAIDARADVFALGAVLCTILTGKPPFIGKSTWEVILRAGTADLAETHARLEGCGADADLVALCRVCLNSNPADRPADGQAVADRLTSYLGGVEQRLEAAERERAVAVAREAEQRKRRRLQVRVAVGVVALTTVAGIAAAWAAIYQNRLRHNALIAQQKADTAREAESKERHHAEAEKKRADITLADMQTSRGLLAGERGAPAEAVLWFAAAAEQAATAGDPQRQQHSRLRARNWMRQATLPVAAMSLDGSLPAQLQFQPGGELLLVRSDRNQTFLWSWREGKILPWADKLPDVGAACFSPDGTSLAVGFLSGEVQIHSVADGRVAAKIQHMGQIRALAFSQNGKWLAIGSKSVRVWDVERNTFLDAVWDHPQPVNALLFNRQGDRLITACDDKRVRVFAVNGKPERREPLYAPLMHSPTKASPPALIDGDRTLVTVTGNKELTRWDMATGKPVSERIQTQPGLLQKVVASPDGKWFVTGGYYGPEVHAARTKKPVLELNHTNQVTSFVFNRDSTVLLSVSWDRTAKLWSLPDGQLIGEPLSHMGSVEQGALSDDANLVATAEQGGLIRVWRRPTDALVLARLAGWGQRPRLSFDGKRVAPGLWHEAPIGYHHQGTNRLRVVSADSGKPAGAVISLPGFLVDSCVCGDNRTVAAVFSHGETGNLGVWDIAKAQPLFDPVELPGLPLSVAARPNSDELAVLCTTGDLLVFDCRSGKTLFQVRYQGWVWGNARWMRVRYTPDGETLLALGTWFRTRVLVYDADTRQIGIPPLQPVLQGGVCRSFALSADSRLLATIVNGKNAAQVWDLATGHPLSQPLPHPGDLYGLFSVRFSPDGRHLLTGSKDGQVRYWDWRTGKLACPPMPHSDEVLDVAITPDGRYALTAVRGAPRRMHVWELATGKPMAPPVRLSDAASESSEMIAVTPDTGRALVGTVRNELTVVDLHQILFPSATPVGDLALLAELATTQSIQAGDLNELTTDQWQKRWNLLHERDPQLARFCVIERSALADQNQAAALRNRGSALFNQGKLPEALTALRKATELEDRNAWTHMMIGMILDGQAKPQEAIRELRRAIEIAPQYPEAFIELGTVLLDRGKLEEGITLLVKAVELQKTQIGPDAPQTHLTMTKLAAAYVRADKLERTLPLLEKLLKRDKEKLGPENPRLIAILAMAELEPDDWKTFHAKSLLGGALLGQKKYAEAEGMLLAGYQGMKKREKTIPSQDKVRLSEAVERLVQLYEAIGKNEETTKWRKELEATQASRKKTENEP